MPTDWEEALEDAPSSLKSIGALAASADEDEYFQSPPRAAYPERKRRTSGRESTDPTNGFSVAGGYCLLSLLLLAGISIWSARARPRATKRVWYSRSR
jgi:hypothetical protein